MIIQEKGKISRLQFILSIACLVQGSTLITSFFYKINHQDAWFAFLLGWIGSIPMIWMYAALANTHPGKNLVEINEIVFGKVAGGILSLVYMGYFLTLATLNLRDLGGFVTGNVLPETPLWAVFIVFMGVCAYAARGGIQLITRHSLFIVTISVAVVIITTVLNVNNMSADHFRPFLSHKPLRYLQGAHIIMAIPFGETFVFLMFLPFVHSKRSVLSLYVKALLLGGTVFMGVIVRDTSVLGPAMSFIIIPSFEAQRMIDIADIFTRLEVLFAIIVMFIMFFKVSIFFYASALGLSQILRLDTYKHICAPLGAFIICYGFVVFSSAVENLMWGMETAAIFTGVFQIMFPVATLITGRIQNKLRAKEAEPA